MPMYAKVITAMIAILFWSYVAFAVFSWGMNLWAAVKGQDVFGNLFRGLNVSTSRRRGDVLVRFHTYRGILISIEQLEHNVWCPPDEARKLIGRFFRFNLSYGSGALFGPVIPIVSFSYWRRERRSVKEQVRNVSTTDLGSELDEFESNDRQRRSPNTTHERTYAGSHPVDNMRPSSVFRVMKLVRLIGLLVMLTICGLFFLISLLNR